MSRTTSRVTIQPVKGWLSRKAFIQFPFTLYADCKSWVPPLRLDTSTLINPKKNAFFAHGDMQLFLARDENNKVVGRIAAIKNGMHLQKYNDGVGFFGFFETVNDVEVANALFDAAAEWLRSQGLNKMRGPANPSLNDVAGLLVDGFNKQPSILMPYNLGYYEGLLQEYGFQKVMTMWAYYAHTKLLKTEKMARGCDLILRKWPSLSVRYLDMSRFQEEARLILDIFNDAWSDNWGHVSMTEGEFQQMAKELKQILDPRLAIIIEDDGHAVGFAVSLPDMNYAFKTLKSGRLLPTGLLKLLFLATSGVIREIRMPLMGVRKSHHGKGLDAMLVYETYKSAMEIGVLGCEMSWVLDNNLRLRHSLESMGGVIDKEYALLECEI